MLVGSANVTNTALGFAATPNVELLVEKNPSDPALQEFERLLTAISFRATREIQHQVEREVGLLSPSLPAPALELLADRMEESPASSWLPTCPRPNTLYQVYRGIAGSELIESTVQAAQEDLAYLRPVAGMTQAAFNAYVGGILRSLPIVERIEELLTTGTVAEDPAHSIIRELHPSMKEGYGVSDYWEVLKAWLMYFFPEVYRTRPAGEVLERSRLISEGPR